MDTRREVGHSERSHGDMRGSRGSLEPFRARVDRMRTLMAMRGRVGKGAGKEPGVGGLAPNAGEVRIARRGEEPQGW